MKRKTWLCIGLLLGICLFVAIPARADIFYKGKISAKALTPGKSVKGKHTEKTTYDNSGNMTISTTYLVYKIKVKKMGISQSPIICTEQIRVGFIFLIPSLR